MMDNTQHKRIASLRIRQRNSKPSDQAKPVKPVQRKINYQEKPLLRKITKKKLTTKKKVAVKRKTVTKKKVVAKKKLQLRGRP